MWCWVQSAGHQLRFNFILRSFPIPEPTNGLDICSRYESNYGCVIDKSKYRNRIRNQIERAYKVDERSHDRYCKSDATGK
jgi:hypothetical protein